MRGVELLRVNTNTHLGNRVIEGVIVLPGVPKGALNVHEITHS